MTRATVTYEEGSDTVAADSGSSTYAERLTPEYAKETAMNAARRLADDPQHRAKVAELRKRIADGTHQSTPLTPEDFRRILGM